MTTALLLGFGAIGRDLISLLGPEIAAGQLTIAGAVVRDVAAHEVRGAEGVRLLERTDVTGALANVDLIIECAGVDAVVEHASWLASRPLILTSVGALANEPTASTLLRSPNLTVTNGAIGGFDGLEAAAFDGGLDAVRITTFKLASTLERPWMSEAERSELSALAAGDAPRMLFVGSPTEAIAKFPANVNVAVALAWATRGSSPQASAATQLQALRSSLSRVEVRLVADPEAELSRHVIEASGRAGHFLLEWQSAPSPSNPRTSGMTARSVARDVRLALNRFERSLSVKDRGA